MGILRQAAEILRRRTLTYKKDHPVIFKGHFQTEGSDVPDTLFFFYKWLLAGNRKLGDKIDTHVASLANTMSQNVLFNIKPDRQTTYNLSRNDIRPSHKYTPMHQICLGLSLCHSARDNIVLNMLSATNCGYFISPRQCLRWERSIANAVIKNIDLNNGIYIPPGMVKDVIPIFHLDNIVIDWLESTPDGKKYNSLFISQYFSKELHEKPTKINSQDSSDFKVKNANLKGKPIQY